jgi:hypothetical protein
MHEEIDEAERELHVASEIPPPGLERLPADKAWRRSLQEWVDRKNEDEEVTPDGASRREEGEPPLRFGQLELVVDGAPVTFYVAFRGAEWLAGAYVGSVWIKLNAIGLSPSEVELQEITDIAPYVEGTRGRLQRRHGLRS